MVNTNFRYLYGPVHSWRLGKSLGIDPLSLQYKICNLDCSYCQLGKTSNLTLKRFNFIPVEDLMHEIATLPDNLEIDHLTFSGRGEPTLASNLGEMITALKAVRKEKIAVITNSLLLDNFKVQEDLKKADVVVAKLDVANNELFFSINRPPETMDFSRLIASLQRFRMIYRGRLALQIMFVAENKDCAPELAKIARAINPDEIQLNTPTRPCSCRPISTEEMEKVKHYFSGLPVVSVFDQLPEESKPFSEQQTKLRHGNYQKELKAFLRKFPIIPQEGESNEDQDKSFN